MRSKKQTFSNDFLWGAATAAYQVEGNITNQWSEWEHLNAQRLAGRAEKDLKSFPSWPRFKKAAQTPENYLSGQASQHATHYEEDFDMLQSMNMNAYRFGIEWARIEPHEGEWDESAITHYRAVLESLNRRGVEPVVTLIHFTLPVWLADKGGLTKKRNVKYVMRYAEKIMAELGDQFRYVITINEPEVYAATSYAAGYWPPAKRNLYLLWRVVANQITAHRKIATMIHERGEGHQVSIAKHSLNLIAGDNWLLSKWVARIGMWFFDDIMLKRMASHCDFLGLNFYQSIQIKKGVFPSFPTEDRTDLNWAVQPSDIQIVIERLYKNFGLPIMITENGLADAEDRLRQFWITETIAAMERAMENGVPLIGYLHWSLLDNFEWAYGKWPRFGLIAVDDATGKRTLRPSAKWFGEEIARYRNS